MNFLTGGAGGGAEGKSSLMESGSKLFGSVFGGGKDSILNGITSKLDQVMNTDTTQRAKQQGPGGIPQPGMPQPGMQPAPGAMGMGMQRAPAVTLPTHPAAAGRQPSPQTGRRDPMMMQQQQGMQGMQGMQAMQGMPGQQSPRPGTQGYGRGGMQDPYHQDPMRPGQQDQYGRQDPYGRRDGSTGRDEYGMGAGRGQQDPYGRQSRQDAYNKDSSYRGTPGKPGSARDPYAKDPYGKDPYGKDPYSKDPYSTKDPYSKDPYSKDPYSTKDPYSKDPYSTKDPYSKDPYSTKDPYSKDPYSTKDPYSKDPYSTKDPYSKDPFGKAKDPYAKDPYSSTAVAKDQYGRDISTSKDGYGRTSATARDPYGREATNKDPYGRTATNAKDPYARDVSKDSMGGTMKDAYGNVIKDPYSSSTKDPYGNPTKDPYGNTTKDPYGNTTKDPYGNTTKDPYGNQAKDPYGNPIKDSYGGATKDAYGRDIKDPYSSTNRDAYGNSTVKDPYSKDPYGSTTKDQYGRDIKDPYGASKDPYGRDASTRRDAYKKDGAYASSTAAAPTAKGRDGLYQDGYGSKTATDGTGYGQQGAFQPVSGSNDPYRGGYNGAEPPKPRPRSREPSPRPMPRPMPRRMSSEALYNRASSPTLDYYRQTNVMASPPVPRARSTPPSPKPRSRRSLSGLDSLSGQPMPMRRGMTGRQGFDATMQGQEDPLYDLRSADSPAEAARIQKLRQQMEALSQQDYALAGQDASRYGSSGMTTDHGMSVAGQQTSPIKTGMAPTSRSGYGAQQGGQYGVNTTSSYGNNTSTYGTASSYSGTTGTGGYGSTASSGYGSASSTHYGDSQDPMARGQRNLGSQQPQRDAYGNIIPGTGLEPPHRRRRGSGDSGTTERCDLEVADHMDGYELDRFNPNAPNGAMFQPGVVGLDISPQYQDPNQMDDHSYMCMQFMNNFVNMIFAGNPVAQNEKAQYGNLCQTPAGRMWLARSVNAKRVELKRVSEEVFYQLVQHFAVALFECNESEDFVPAKNLMNMCFTFYYEAPSQYGLPQKHYLYNYLKDQPIWQSLRFWNAAFFDAVQCERERARKPRDIRASRMDDREYQENITFGQLGTFTCNMRALGLQKDLCMEFLRKQAQIAGMRESQVQMIRDNIDRWVEPHQ